MILILIFSIIGFNIGIFLRSKNPTIELSYGRIPDILLSIIFTFLSIMILQMVQQT